MRTTRRQDIVTSHCRIAVESAGYGSPVVFIRGNSACRQVFQKQLASTLLDNYHMITFDLPGHGDSSDATDPERTYTLPGLADLTVELLYELGIGKAAVVGASLGGHVAIEMLDHSTIPQGLFLMGTPSLGADMAEGFRGRPLGGLGAKPALDPQEVERFATAVFGANAERFMYQAIERTDKAFRGTLFEGAARGLGIDQREALTTSPILSAIVHGEDDQIINLDYVDSVAYANLWQDTCFRIPHVSHSPFWEASERANSLLADFLADVTRTWP
ncbi:alpha/beta hydrolase [Agrobacterium sp. B1(2019)]|uniref:alpha/beta fold hydrolase n=1 Tax=Agrobacterium sp. B1(2019) TaxID=2607032 RepID=UPI0011EED36A|nr:alpha/beta hydrolase [Agrobacterium sp. B1(2019)]TZG31257.1 alpha/beta hydrolase [Agrobacterium sp. B1(2019)]